MRQSSIPHAKDWCLRQRITEINKALRACKTNQAHGMASILAEDLERELKLIRAEQEKRKSAIAADK